MSQESAVDAARRIAEAAASESCAAVLGELSALLRRFVVLSPAQARVVGLWIAHTYLVDAADATPYLAVTSAEKRSGKTRLLEVLELVVARPWFTGRTTAAVLPRKIDAERPTLLLDESDAAFGGDKEYAEALRGVLNTGHRRGGRTTVCVGQGANIGFKDFSTFCPKAIAGIGKLPDTVADRAIPVRLERRAPGEQVERFRRRHVEPQAQQLRQRLAALAEVAGGLLRDACPTLPDELDDRALDGVEPLLAIAELAGGEWSALGRAACVGLHGGRQVEDESSGVQLLSDIRAVLGDDDRITTTGLLDRLNGLDEAPWSEDGWLTSRGLAKLLKPYRISSTDVWVAEAGKNKSLKGFKREQFEGAFSRYLPRYPRERENPQSAAENSGSVSAREEEPSRIEIGPDPALGADSRGLADRGPSRDPEAGCVCRTPARSPRAGGPDVCQTCKRPMT